MRRTATPRLETEPRHARFAGNGDDVPEHHPADASAPGRLRRVHRLDFTVPGREPLQRADTEQRVVGPCRPEVDPGRAERLDREGVRAALGGRRARRTQMVLEQPTDAGIVEASGCNPDVHAQRPGGTNRRD